MPEKAYVDSGVILVCFLLPLIILNIHLVELVAQPYVKTSVSSTFKWCEHNASLLYRIAQIAFFNPVWYDELITKGLVKHHQNPRYRPFDEDFKEAFGCDL